MPRPFRSLTAWTLAAGLMACASQPVEPPEVSETPPSPPLATPVVPESPAVAPTPAITPVTPASFAECVPLLKARAIAAGVSPRTVEPVLSRVKEVPQVLGLDRKQPEFSDPFSRYYSLRVNDQRIEQGRRHRATHRALFDSIERKHRVPAEVLISFWGLESNFGGYMGSMPVMDSLATLACDTRRSEFFTRELIDALRLVEAGVVTPERFKGSWAGAVGNMQFMPSTYRRHAVDADGSGHPDLWRSIPDAMTSAAAYLQAIGWKGDQPWGLEVRLPAGFDYTHTGRQTRKPLAAWSALGVRQASGAALPAGGWSGSVLVPTGHTGPAFLVGPNFEVILQWNRSEFYALSVGLLSDRIAGQRALVKPLPSLPRISIAAIRDMQTVLNAAGYEAGVVDGILGSGTRHALRQWQSAQGLVADGYPSAEVFKHMGIPNR